MSRRRSEIASTAAARLSSMSAAGRLTTINALVGFDGFIDAIIRVVDARASMAPSDFVPIPTIDALARRVAAAAGLSANMELVVHEERFGGNGPLMAGALGSLSLPVTYIGGVGRPGDERTLHPIYEPFARRCAKVYPVSAPAFTDALEFDDGKLMLGKPGNLQGITWASLKTIFGLPALIDLFASQRLIGIVNWTMMGGVQGIWQGLCDEVLPKLPVLHIPGHMPIVRRRIFIDLADPAKRTDPDIRSAMATLRNLEAHADVTLGLNLAEAVRIDRALNSGAFASCRHPSSPTGPEVASAAEVLRNATGLSCVVIHPRSGAGASDSMTAAAWFDGPMVAKPRLSTGAGDHFNAGFSLAQAAGLPLEECLAAGTATSGAYVRDAESPTLARLCEMLAALPEPQA